MPTDPNHISAEALPDLQALLDALVGIAEDHLPEAVKVSAEHAFGESVSFYLPYQATPTRDLLFGRMTARPRPRSMLAVGG